MDGGRMRALVDLAYDAGSAEDLDHLRVAVTAGIRRVVPADLASYTEIDLETGGRVQIGIAVNRSGRTFTPADRQSLELLRPVLIRAYRRVLELERRKATNLTDHAILRLTPRQREIVELVANGATNQQIAHELGISLRTVENHLHTAYRQLEVSNRTAAAAIARAL